MAIRSEQIQLTITADAKQIREQLTGLQKEITSLNDSIEDLTPGTEAYNQQLSKIIANTKKFADAASFKDLRKEYNSLRKEVESLTPGTEAYIRKSAQLDVVRDKFKEVGGAIRGNTQSLESQGGILGGLKSKIAAFSVAAAAAFVAAKVMEYGKELFKLGSSLEILDKKAKTVFGSTLPFVNKAAEKNAEQMGLTTTEYINQAAAIQDLLIPMGFQREEAARVSTETTNLAGALSEWTGGQKSATEVTDILSKAMLGEREQLKTLGIAISENDVTNALAEKGLEKLTGASLQQAKAMVTLELITAKSADAQEAFANGSDSMVRKSATLTARFNEIKEQLAVALIPIFSRLLDVVEAAADQFDKNVSRIGSLIAAFKRFFDVIGLGDIEFGKFLENSNLLSKALEFASLNFTLIITGITKFLNLLTDGVLILGSFKDTAAELFSDFQSFFGDDSKSFTDVFKKNLEKRNQLDKKAAKETRANAIESAKKTAEESAEAARLATEKADAEALEAAKKAAAEKAKAAAEKKAEEDKKAAEKAAAEAEKLLAQQIAKQKQIIEGSYTDEALEDLRFQREVESIGALGVLRTELTEKQLAALEILEKEHEENLLDIRADRILQQSDLNKIESVQRLNSLSQELLNEEISLQEFNDRKLELDADLAEKQLEQKKASLLLLQELKGEDDLEVLELQAEIDEEEIALYRAKEEAKTEITQQEAEKRKSIIDSFSKFSQDIGNTLTKIFEIRKDSELAKAGDNEAKKLEIEKKYAKRAKAMAISQAIANTAVGITRTIAEVPKVDFGISTAALIALYAAMGAVEVATISKQQFAKGGIANNKQGVIGGEPHAKGGTTFYGTDGSVFEAEKGELMTVVNAKNTKLLSQLSNLNAFGGNGIPFFEAGGVAYGATSAPNISGLVVNAQGQLSDGAMGLDYNALSAVMIAAMQNATFLANYDPDELAETQSRLAVIRGE